MDTERGGNLLIYDVDQFESSFVVSDPYKVYHPVL